MELVVKIMVLIVIRIKMVKAMANIVITIHHKRKNHNLTKDSIFNNHLCTAKTALRRRLKEAL